VKQIDPRLASALGIQLAHRRDLLDFDELGRVELGIA
jgi:hypothetical protein